MSLEKTFKNELSTGLFEIHIPIESQNIYIIIPIVSIFVY